MENCINNCPRGDRTRDDLCRICKTCPDRTFHMSDCSLHNLPAQRAGKCDCGVEKAKASRRLQE